MSFVLCKVGSHHLRVGANRRDDVLTELRASATTVLNLLVSSIVIYIYYTQCVLMRLNKYLFNTVNNKERGCCQRSVVWLKRGQPCLHHLHVLSTVFSWQPFSLFSLWIILLTPSLPPFILPMLNQCDRCLFPLVWGLMDGERGFASHGVVTLSRGWLCQRWKLLDIPGTHLHSVTQLLTGKNHSLICNCCGVLF